MASKVGGRVPLRGTIYCGRGQCSISGEPLTLHRFIILFPLLNEDGFVRTTKLLNKSHRNNRCDNFPQYNRGHCRKSSLTAAQKKKNQICFKLALCCEQARTNSWQRRYQSVWKKNYCSPALENQKCINFYFQFCSLNTAFVSVW